jgi:hypothetical protein
VAFFTLFALVWPPCVYRHDMGSDIHVMLALCRSSRQVVVADEELNGTHMIGELLRE